MLEAILHHVRQAAQRAGVNWSSDCDAELQAEAEDIERRFTTHRERLDDLEARIEKLEEGTGAWRDRR